MIFRFYHWKSGMSILGKVVCSDRIVIVIVYYHQVWVGLGRFIKHI